MKKYNFDKVINRKGNYSVKYDGIKRIFKEDDLFPMWVADMDFETPEYITEAIKKQVNHGLFGYPEYPKDLYKYILDWIDKKHNWSLDKKNITLSPTVVASLSIAIEAFSEIGDKVISFTPVYGPFYSVVKNQNRELVESPLIENDGYYTMDFNDLESKIDVKTKVLLLCSPHNPTGRVWKKEELKKLGKICVKNNIIIVSDEIHSDIIYNTHTPIATISSEIKNSTLTLNSTGKTFNVSGLEISYLYSDNLELLAKFKNIMKKRAIGVENVLSLVMLEAAYKDVENYTSQLSKYLESNIDYAIDYLKIHLPKLKINKPEGTYLLWLDFREFALSHKEISTLLLKKGKLALTDGLFFGKDGDRFFRLNVALAKERLKIGLERLVKAFD